jgi:hypothetical protein
VSQADVKPGCVLRQSNFVQVSIRLNITLHALARKTM